MRGRGDRSQAARREQDRPRREQNRPRGEQGRPPRSKFPEAGPTKGAILRQTEQAAAADLTKAAILRKVDKMRRFSVTYPLFSGCTQRRWRRLIAVSSRFDFFRHRLTFFDVSLRAEFAA